MDNPTIRSIISAKNKGKTLTESHKAKISNAMKIRWTNPEFRMRYTKKNTGKKMSSKTKAKISMANTGKRRTPEQCMKISNARRGKSLDMEHRNKVSDALKGRIFSEDHKTKIGEASKKRWSDSVYKTMVSVKIKESQADPMFRAKRSLLVTGANHPNWHGGTSFEPYCPKFNSNTKEKIREQFGRLCAMPLCGKSEQENGRKLDCHHTDYNKMQGCGNRPWSIVPLCIKCHIKTQRNRWYWFSLLYNHWAIYPTTNLCEPGMY